MKLPYFLKFEPILTERMNSKESTHNCIPTGTKFCMKELHVQNARSEYT